MQGSIAEACRFSERAHLGTGWKKCVWVCVVCDNVQVSEWITRLAPVSQYFCLYAYVCKWVVLRGRGCV